MGYFVYIIESISNGSYYKGFSEHPYERLSRHNLGLSRYTSAKIPWKLVYIEEFSSKRAALIREKKIKKYGRDQIERLIVSPGNMHKG